MFEERARKKEEEIERKQRRKEEIEKKRKEKEEMATQRKLDIAGRKREEQK
ncbi:hypothetical protein DPMN_024345 [Dreissena polymorpha]|uniref:Uncharacterized protein n=1 Tax=Dreissena polymorpha TaxID=45954 RepID=A0A9D4CNZ8_DREPO|nr:hypothetical protein DPMN_054494 [Dreissena polymorpha]KAH3861417.1 hypothetical protein DPMN_024345 [Dreissena polymorpha]